MLVYVLLTYLVYLLLRIGVSMEMKTEADSNDIGKLCLCVCLCLCKLINNILPRLLTIFLLNNVKCDNAF